MWSQSDLFALFSEILGKQCGFYPPCDPHVYFKIVIATSCMGSERDEFPCRWLLSKFAGVDTVDQVLGLRSLENCSSTLFSESSLRRPKLSIAVDHLSLFEQVLVNKVVLSLILAKFRIIMCRCKCCHFSVFSL